MADRHRRKPISIRFTDDERRWLTEQSHKNGEAVQAIVIRAVREFRARYGTNQRPLG